MKEFINIENKYLADAINFLTGMRYYKFINDNGKEVYSFQNTDKFNQAFHGLTDLKKSLNK